MASAGYSRPQNYSSIRDDDDDDALDIRVDSNNQRDGSVKALHGQVQEVVGVMKQNIDRILDRDVALNNLANRADDLQTSAQTYNQTTKRLSNKYWWKNMKTNVCIGGIVLVVVLIIILSVAVGRKKN